MRQIDIDTAVFAAIWACRQPGEETENDVLRRVLVEGKISGAIDQHGSEEMLGKVRWVDDIVAVLRDFSGSATLTDIYDAVRIRRKREGRSLTREYKATVRRTLEDHSSDSANYRAADLFKLVDRGVWALR